MLWTAWPSAHHFSLNYTRFARIKSNVGALLREKKLQIKFDKWTRSRSTPVDVFWNASISYRKFQFLINSYLPPEFNTRYFLLFLFILAPIYLPLVYAFSFSQSFIHKMNKLKLKWLEQNARTKHKTDSFRNLLETLQCKTNRSASRAPANIEKQIVTTQWAIAIALLFANKLRT